MRPPWVAAAAFTVPDGPPRPTHPTSLEYQRGTHRQAAGAKTYEGAQRLYGDVLDTRQTDSLRSGPRKAFLAWHPRTHIRLRPHRYLSTDTRCLYLREPHPILTCSMLALATSQAVLCGSAANCLLPPNMGCQRSAVGFVLRVWPHAAAGA